MQSVGWSRWTEILRVILEGYFRGIGHILILISTVLIVPSMIFFAEVERCVPPGDSDTNNQGEAVYYTCLQGGHPASIAMVVIGCVSGLILTLFTLLFVNS